MIEPPIVLASGSPRRRELLASLGISFEVITADVDETVLPVETPYELVSRLALTKSSTVALQYPDRLVIGSDTIVVLDGKILGKPKNVQEAKQFLSQLQGRPHTVYTGVSLVKTCNRLQDVRVSSTEVFIRPMTDGEIDAYVATGEPMDKAGAYAIQGIGATLVEKIQGDYFTVVGLPLHLLDQMLTAAGYSILGNLVKRA